MYKSSYVMGLQYLVSECIANHVKKISGESKNLRPHQCQTVLSVVLFTYVHKSKIAFNKFIL